MTYDLRHECWIPWRRRSGTVEWGPPWLLTDGIAGDDPIVALAAPRPDFDGALQEFLIGLLGVALQVPDEEVWEALWRSPPTPEALRAALDRLPQAFDLDGEGPRFFQALPTDDLEAVTPLPIEELLVDAKAGVLFVKPGRVGRIGRPAAAMALLTMQTYAPEGGRGHYTSLRAGGPLTTLVDPRLDAHGHLLAHRLPLWQKLWSNVETTQEAARRSPATGHVAPADVFPWLAPVRTGAEIAEANASPWQAYFGLPRRIRFDFDGPGPCELTDRDDEVTVSAFRLRPNGVKYGSWRHPLTPRYQSAKKEMLAVRGQPGGVGWRDWLGLTFGAADGSHEPALAVARFTGATGRARRLGLGEARLHAFGFATNKAKARGWTDALQPVLAAASEAQEGLLRDLAARLVEAASLAASLLLGAVKRASFAGEDDPPGDLSAVRDELWAATERDFFEAMRAAATPDTAEAIVDEHCRRFASRLSHESLAIFDRLCPGDASEPVAMRRVVTARYNLARALGGWTPLGEKLFETLRIPLPGGGRAARLATSARSRTRKEAKT